LFQLYVYGNVPLAVVAVAVPLLTVQPAGVEAALTLNVPAEAIDTVPVCVHPFASVTVAV
jgi:hypothetical protein